MTAAMTRSQFGLAALCGTLGAAFLYELFAPLPSYAIPAAHARSTVAIGAPPAAFMPPPATAFAAVADRPLFDPTRRKFVPPPSAAREKAAPPPPPNLSLVGVIIDSERRLALMKSSEGALAMSYGVGDQIDGWQVAEVDPDRVLLKAGTAEDAIRMDANKAPAAQGSPPQAAVDQSSSQHPSTH